MFPNSNKERVQVVNHSMDLKSVLQINQVGKKSRQSDASLSAEKQLQKREPQSELSVNELSPGVGQSSSKAKIFILQRSSSRHSSSY